MRTSKLFLALVLLYVVSTSALGQQIGAGCTPIGRGSSTTGFFSDCTSVSGTANAIVITPIFGSVPTTPQLVRYTTYRFQATATNTAATTIRLGSGPGPYGVYTNAGTALSGGEITSGQWYSIGFDPALNAGMGGWRLLSNNLGVANIWTGANTFAPPTAANPAVTISPLAGSLGQGLVIGQTPSGSASTAQSYNLISASADSATITGANFGVLLNVSLVINGAAVQGGRVAVHGYTQLAASTNASNGIRNYSGLLGTGTATASDGGTNTGVGALGAIFGSSAWGDLQSGATNFLNVTGGEYNCSIRTDATARYKSCMQLVEHALDAVSGAELDAMLAIGGQAGAIGVNAGISFSSFTGQHAVRSTGTLIAATGGAFANGLDFSLSTFSSNFLLGPGSTSSIDGTGIGVLAASLRTPLHIGGLLAGSGVEIRATTGVGIGSEIIKFTGGNNGAKEFGRFTYGASGADELLIGTTSQIALANIAGARLNGATGSILDLLGSGSIFGRLQGDNVNGLTVNASASPSTILLQAAGSTVLTVNTTSVQSASGIPIAAGSYLSAGTKLRAVGPAPTLGSCGMSPAIEGSDLSGTVTVGTGGPTSCIFTFNTTYANAPRCNVTWRDNLPLMQYSVSASQLILAQTSTSSNLIDYICTARSGG